MSYKIRNTLVPVPYGPVSPGFEEILFSTLNMYCRGDDLSNSPLITTQLNKWHKSCHRYEGEELRKCLLEKQGEFIQLYESFKQDGYNGSPMLVWFDEDGYIHLYDGYHRLLIMKYLGIEAEVNCETEWTGIDSLVGKDFPLAEVLAQEQPRGRMLYHPVEDLRVASWRVERQDSPSRLEYILNNLTGKTVLDIGCSEGYFARGLAKEGYEVTAIDSSEGLVAAARYLTILGNIEVDYVVGDWRKYLSDSQRFDNILFLSILHNQMKADGVEPCLRSLELFRGRAEKVFFEVPNNTNERQWMVGSWPKFDFHKNLPSLEQYMGMKVQGKHNAMRTTYIFKEDGLPLPWWNLESWLTPIRTHYKSLFNTLRTKPCRNIMEVGTHSGDTAIVMIKAAAEKVPEEEIHYFGFDLFEDMTPQLNGEEFGFMGRLPPSVDSVKARIEEATKAKVTLIKGNTRKTLRKTVKTLPKMDLVYIDGGHTVETTRNDWKYASKLVHKDTVVYFDDYCDEMPFMGAKFIVGELSPRYAAQVMPEVNYYPRQFGRLKSQLLRVEVKSAITAKLATDHYRFHILGLAHSKTTKEWVMCPFTQLTYKMCQMLVKMGHEVYHYGTEGSNPQCTEQIDVLTDAVQKQAYGDWNVKKQLWIHSGGDLAYTTFRKNAVEEIKLRQQPGDILLISIGNWYKSIADALPAMPAVEPYVGYLGCFSKYKVFPSYAWMHHLYGAMAKSTKENFAMGQWYDAVIPHYFDPEDFEFRDKKEDYYLYVGRFITRKGVHVAGQVCKALGAKLVATGQLLDPGKKEECLHQLGLDQPHVEYLEPVGRERRNELMGKARAVFIPSLYLEPFGKVVIEALLCGTPVITTDWGSFPELVKHGVVGYRCRTMDDFLWAARNVDKLSPADCREYAVANYSMDRISKMYQEYFMKIHDLFSGGWYQEHPERKNLDWLKKY